MISSKYKIPGTPLILALILLFSYNSTQAQDIAAWVDVYGNLNVFDSGKTERIEFLEVDDLQLGGDYLVYVDNLQNFIHYSKGEKQIIQNTPPSIIKVTDHYMATTLNSILHVIDGQKLEKVSFRPNNPYRLGDSIIAYVEYDDYLYVHDIYEDEIELAVPTVSEFKVSDNTLAWIDPSNMFYIYYKGESEEVDSYAPMAFSVGNQMTAYIDDYEEFKIYHRGEITELESYPPAWFLCGDEMLVYLSDEGEFKIHYNGETENYGDVSPAVLTNIVNNDKKREVNTFLDFHRRDDTGGRATPSFKSGLVDNTVYWLDRNGHLNYWSEGTSGILTSYEPQRVKADTDIIAWMDIDGRLKAYYKGEKVDISDQIIDDFYIHGSVIVYRQNKNEYRVYWNGETY